MIQALALILIFCVNIYAKEKPENLLQALPSAMSYFAAGEMKVYDEAELGASIGYNRASLLGQTWATVYVYDLGTNKINDTITNKAYEMGIDDIYAKHKDIKLIDKGKKIIHIQNKNYEIRYSMFQLLLLGTKKTDSYIFVSGNQDYIYKVRITTNEKNMRNDMIEFSYKIISLLLSLSEKKPNTLK